MASAPTAQPPRLEELINLERYPVNDLESPAAQHLIQQCRERLAEDGCVVLTDFLTPEARATVQAETRTLSPQAAYTHKTVNAYFSEDDPELAEDDPRRIFMDRKSGFVPRDSFPQDSALKALYEAEATNRFLAACFNVPALYTYDDPLAGLTINVVPLGAQFPWHFDTNHFAVTLMTQKAEQGGCFEYAPGIRTPDNENLEGVAKVLRGTDREPVKSLDLDPGDLQLFMGRYSLHRVSPVAGSTERHMAVLAYCQERGMIGRVERTEQLFGRVTEHHLNSQESLRRDDTLVD